MKITIIGWYGTETIGDRAILAGLFSIFSKVYDNFEIKLGSLYPFFSERTIREDSVFWREIIGRDINIELFNSKKSAELDKAISESSMVVLGGGPLMHIDELFMVEYAFKKAKKHAKMTALLGCGMGPLFYKQHKKSVLEIVKYSDLIILRDTKSKDTLRDIFKDFRESLNTDRIFTSMDPSVECVLEYNKLNTRNQREYISVNLREFPADYAKKQIDVSGKLVTFIENLADKYNNREVMLIPMHYFHSGNDDRAFLNSIALKLRKNNIRVQNKNLTLKETIMVYQNAYFNIGMRFHSVVLQILASGKNYILDYTQPQKGKIYGFLQDIDDQGFYKDRYTNLQIDEISSTIIKNENRFFLVNNMLVNEKMHVYLEKLRELNQ
ncbi:MAG: polysaccharide pyruvyl transferase family protein [Candidatus Omnitrophica bacterium]|nr:polysaccharide pyruvyl transferase family protein [Candidatus Omnitrophota bacterium]MCG2708264.1 polysaccharide pyruvyl transferase family protein [Candidatus Omnitrophota bacterium]